MLHWFERNWLWKWCDCVRLNGIRAANASGKRNERKTNEFMLNMCIGSFVCFLYSRKQLRSSSATKFMFDCLIFLSFAVVVISVWIIVHSTPALRLNSEQNNVRFQLRTLKRHSFQMKFFIRQTHKIILWSSRFTFDHLVLWSPENKRIGNCFDETARGENWKHEKWTYHFVQALQVVRYNLWLWTVH